MNAPKLTGNRCQCTACGERFNGLAGFEAHRIGAFGSARRCLTIAEMTAHGWTRNAAAFWVTDSHAQRATRHSAEGVEAPRGIAPMQHQRPTPTAHESAHASTP